MLLSLFATVACSRGPQPDPHVTAPPFSSSASRAPNLPGPLRVVTLGDSLAYGTGDEGGGGISGRLEVELSDRGVPGTTTVNLGVNSAQTSDVLARLRQENVRDAIASADAIILSIGANDLWRTPAARAEAMRAPLGAAERILTRIDAIVTGLHRLNTRARVLILGGYNPAPRSTYSAMIDRYVGLWDEALIGHFEPDPLVSVVKMSDLVAPDRLSRRDSFHPGGKACSALAERIAEMLLQPTHG